MRILSSRIGWIFVAVHSVLYAVAMWQRGGPGQMFHAVYEPWLMLLLMVADIFWFIVMPLFVPSNIYNPGLFLVQVGMISAIQWYCIGYAIERRAANNCLPIF